MILQALTHYYDILSKDPDSDIAPPGYSSVGVSFALNISAQGELLDVFPLFQQVQSGNKMVEKPRRMIVPEQIKRAVNISANFLWDNCVYVLGLSDKEAKDPEYAQKRFEAFRQFHRDLLTKADCDTARAILAFFDVYDPAKGREHPAIVSNLETMLLGGNLVFMFRGVFAHDDPILKQTWEAYQAGKDTVLGQCLVTGEVSPIARLHPSLKGIRDANPTGASLVGFNAHAYESYHREQGQNSPVSEKAAFAYTTALNYLLSPANPNKKLTIGDTTVVYWAESEKKGFAEAFEGIFEPQIVEEPVADNQEGRKKAEKGLKEVALKVRRVQKLDLDALLEDLKDENPRFYVLGLAPNAARVSVRFFLTDPFQKIVDRMMQHYRDLDIVKEYENQPPYITVRHILDETVSKKSRDKDASPLMAGAVMRSILTGAPYPAALYYAIINRIRADVDDDQKHIRKIGYVRAAIIKAYLIRKYRNQAKYQEVLDMSLNEQATTPAYVLGRLFAVLEKVQQEAIGDMNASIKDRYFTSACASPASVFPVLLRLSQHHIAKVKQEPGVKMNYDRRIQEILGLLDVEKNPIPARLTLDEQGIFVLGYYHQRAAFYVKNNASTEATSTEIK
jgi:CRISPR-associated protein Csd1